MFPHLVLLGKGVPVCGTLPAYVADHMLIQLDQRFAKDSNFIFTLCNQLYRHIVVRGVSTLAKTNAAAFEKLADIVSMPDIMVRLASAAKDPTSANTKNLIELIAPLVQTSAAKQSFGFAEVRASIPLLLSCFGAFGTAGNFLTTAPADIDSVLMIRLSMIPTSNRDAVSTAVNLQIPVYAARVLRASKNPVAC